MENNKTVRSNGYRKETNRNYEIDDSIITKESGITAFNQTSILYNKYKTLLKNITKRNTD